MFGRFGFVQQSLEKQVQSHLSGLLQSTAVAAGQEVRQEVAKKLSTPWFGGDAKDAYARYRNLYDLGAILQCQYAVHVYDIFNIQDRADVVIPWFAGSFPMSWLATEVDLSLGSLETESYHAGAYQAAYVTGQTSSSIDVTFIETRNMDISKSYQACKNLATPKDGTVNEPKKYAFRLTLNVFGNNPRNYQGNEVLPIFEIDHIVCVKEANISLSSSGRSEIIKINVVFEKLVPYDVYKNSARYDNSIDAGNAKQQAKKAAQNLVNSFMGW